MKLLPTNIEQLDRDLIEFTPENEDTPIDDMFSEPQDVQWIYDQIDSGNDAAWFFAKVEIKYRGFSATDYLGCCSYASFKEFQNDVYYPEMVQTCVNEINQDIEQHNREIQKAWDIRKAKNLLSPYKLQIVKELY